MKTLMKIEKKMVSVCPKKPDFLFLINILRMKKSYATLVYTFSSPITSNTLKKKYTVFRL